MCVISLCTRGALDRWSRGRSTAALGDMDQPSQLESSAKEYPAASKVAGGLIGFFAGLAGFGTAFFATDRDGVLPFGITWFGLGMLLLASIAVGSLAGRKWKSTLLVQVLATTPYVALLMLGQPQTFTGSLSYPGLLWGVSALGIYVGSKLGALANVA